MATTKNVGQLLVDRAKELDSTFSPDGFNDMGDALSVILPKVGTGGSSVTPIEIDFSEYQEGTSINAYINGRDHKEIVDTIYTALSSKTPILLKNVLLSSYEDESSTTSNVVDILCDHPVTDYYNTTDSEESYQDIYHTLMGQYSFMPLSVFGSDNFIATVYIINTPEEDEEGTFNSITISGQVAADKYQAIDCSSLEFDESSTSFKHIIKITDSDIYPTIIDCIDKHIPLLLKGLPSILGSTYQRVTAECNNFGYLWFKPDAAQYHSCVAGFYIYDLREDPSEDYSVTSIAESKEALIKVYASDDNSYVEIIIESFGNSSGSSTAKEQWYTNDSGLVWQDYNGVTVTALTAYNDFYTNGYGYNYYYLTTGDIDDSVDMIKLQQPFCNVTLKKIYNSTETEDDYYFQGSGVFYLKSSSNQQYIMVSAEAELYWYNDANAWCLYMTNDGVFAAYAESSTPSVYTFKQDSYLYDNNNAKVSASSLSTVIDQLLIYPSTLHFYTSSTIYRACAYIMASTGEDDTYYAVFPGGWGNTGASVTYRLKFTTSGGYITYSAEEYPQYE